MKYKSTRSRNLECSAAEAIKMGLAADGGLFVPERFPAFSLQEIEDMKSLSYNGRAVKILSRFLTDFTEEEIKECVDAAYNKSKFETESITPVYKLNQQVYFLELWHGITCAFKDMALQILPHLLTKSIKKTNDDKTVVILVATSGDTGKAALEGFRDIDGTKIAVFYPENGVSSMQKLQMTTQEGENVVVGAICGNFDDAQSAVKAIFTDEEYKAYLNKKGFMLSSANSINWGRLVPQIVYYFSCYADMLLSEEITLGEKVNFVVPTGNFGDILAGYYAMLMGLPVNKLVCASNKNNVLTDFINTGIYNRNRTFYTTSSPSMDILISSNLERFLYDITGNDCARVKGWMEELAAEGRYEIPDISKQKVKEILWGGYCGEEDTLLAIKDTFEAYGYVMDPHTAVAKNVYDQYFFETGDTTKSIILSTASPFKFNRDVLKALTGGVAEDADEFSLLDDLAKISGMKIPQSLAQLKSKSVRFDETLKKANMRDFVNKSLGIN
ncbi:MAG: threonine synthase [Eubacteriales bacterium]|jgi:threonine synthase|nr:threonine synthase [Eubacteriales bacterium]